MTPPSTPRSRADAARIALDGEARRRLEDLRSPDRAAESAAWLLGWLQERQADGDD